MNMERINDDGFIARYASVKETGNVTEVTEMLSISNPVTININKDLMVDLRTGEVIEKNHADNKSELSKSVRESLKGIRDLVNVNCTESPNIRWSTFTYAENMTDTVRLKHDFEVFLKRFKRWCIKYGYLVPEYISVVEPQARGAWHMHVFFIWPCEAPFIPNAELAAMWGQGFVSVKAVNNVDNIGAYFSAYLADVAVDDFEKGAMPSGRIVEKVSEDGRTRKKYIKGGRLHLYPAGMKICRHSRGIKYPEVERVSPDDVIKKKASAGTLTFSSCFAVMADDGGVVNIIRKSYYNSKRTPVSNNLVFEGDEMLAEFLQWYECIEKLEKVSVSGTRSVIDGHEQTPSQEDST